MLHKYIKYISYGEEKFPTFTIMDNIVHERLNITTAFWLNNKSKKSNIQ